MHIQCHLYENFKGFFLLEKNNPKIHMEPQKALNLEKEEQNWKHNSS